jgi:hypothetical protein
MKVQPPEPTLAHKTHRRAKWRGTVEALSIRAKMRLLPIRDILET